MSESKTQTHSRVPEGLRDYMNEKMFEAQPELESLWQQLEQSNMQEIPVGDIVDSSPTQSVLHGERNYAPDPVIGLNKGNLIAIQTKHSGSEAYEMVDLERDATYMTQYPANPIMIANDKKSKYVPEGVILEKFPWGYRIGPGVSNDYWFHHIREARYFDLPISLALEGNKLRKKITDKHR